MPMHSSAVVDFNSHLFQKCDTEAHFFNAETKNLDKNKNILVLSGFEVL